MSVSDAILQSTLAHQVRAIRTGEVNAVELVEGYLQRIREHNPELGAVVYLDEGRALAQASDVDQRLARGEYPRKLEGIPYLVKDNAHVAGMPTQYGSKAFGKLFQIVDDPLVARLRAAGAIVIGKTAMPELGMHSATYSETFGVSRNPWSLSRTPGGSSGGSAAAVAAGLASFATGSDSGGSIRTPAAFCGLVGHKPTTGLLPRANGSSRLSSPGFLTRSVTDTARLLDVTSGVFSGDRLSFVNNVSSFEKLLPSKQTGKLRVAWSDNLGYAPMEPELVATARSALDRLLICNPEVIEHALSVQLPNIYFHWIIDSLNFAGASMSYDGVDIDLLDTRTRELLRQYSKADVAAQICVERAYVNLEHAFAALFENVDILATPATACLAFVADAEIPHYIAGQEAQWTGAEPVSMFANVVGAPALVIPAGLTDEGLPVGLQLVARRCQDLMLLQLAYQYEKGHPWPQVAPAFCK